MQSEVPLTDTSKIVSPHKKLIIELMVIMVDFSHIGFISQYDTLHYIGEVLINLVLMVIVEVVSVIRPCRYSFIKLTWGPNIVTGDLCHIGLISKQPPMSHFGGEIINFVLPVVLHLMLLLVMV